MKERLWGLLGYLVMGESPHQQENFHKHYKKSLTMLGSERKVEYAQLQHTLTYPESTWPELLFESNLTENSEGSKLNDKPARGIHCI